VSLDIPPETGPPPGQFGAGVMNRLRLPGPTHLRPRPSRIGSIASSSGRFAAALARPIPVRQRLQGPEIARVHSFRDAGAQPPRWWYPEPAATPEQARPPRHFGRPERLAREQLPRRGLPRAAHRMPDEQTRLSMTPGGIVESLVSTVAPVRRMDAVVAAGPMLTSHDRAKLNAVSAAARSARAREAVARETATASGQRGGGTPAPGAIRRTPAKPGAALPAAPAPARTPGQQATPAGSPAGSPESEPAGSSQPASPSARTAPSTAPSGTALSSGAPDARATWLPARAPRFDTARRTARSGGSLFAPGRASATGATNAGSVDEAGSGREGGAVSSGGGLRSATAPRLGGALAGGTSLGVPGPAVARGTSTLRRMVGGAHAVRPALSIAQARLSLFAPAALAGRPERTETSMSRAPAAKHAHGPGAPGSATTAATPAATTPRAQAPAGQGRSTTNGVPATGTAATAGPTPKAGTSPTAGTAPTPGSTAAAPATWGATAQPQHAGRSGSAAASAPPGAPDASAPPAASGTAPAFTSLAGPTASALRRSARRSEPRGVDLATARGLAGSVQPNRLLSPALAVAQLPSSSSYPGWLPGRIPAGEPARPGTLRRSPARYRADHADPSMPAGTNPERLLRTADPRAMSDLLASGRSAVHGAAPEQPRALASAFGPGEQIRPAGAAAPRGVMPAGLATPGPIRSDVPVSAAASAFAASAFSGPGRRPGTRTERGPRGTDQSASSPDRGDRPGATGRAGLARAGRAASASLPAPNYLPAPPPVSLNRSPAARAGSPAVPASAQPGAPALARGPDGTLRRSLVDTTADLFRAQDSAELPSDDLQEGQQMAQNDPARLRVVRSGDTGFTAEAVTQEVSVLDDPRRLQELVDTVVERIEAKVVDELERRGRRHTPGAF
jgi:hypothetical protein